MVQAEPNKDSHGLLQTLHHWDLPQNLHGLYGGWINKDDLARFARVGYEAFRDRVKHCALSILIFMVSDSPYSRLTRNEPSRVVILERDRGFFVCSDQRVLLRLTPSSKTFSQFGLVL